VSALSTVSRVASAERADALARLRTRGGILTLMAATVATLAAVYSGWNMGAGGSKIGAVAPLAFLVGGLLGVLACTRFGAFVFLVLGVRASITLFKLSGSTTGTTTGNDAASRGLDPSVILGILFVLAAGLWLAAQFFRHGFLVGSRLRLALVTFWTAGLISAFGSAVPIVSLTESLRILAVVMMYIVLEQLITTRKAMINLLLAVYASTLFPLGYTALTFVVSHPPSEVKGSYTRISGTLGQATAFGRYLSYVIVFGVAVLPYLNKRAKRAMVVILGLSSVFLLLTLTRGALIATILGVVIVSVMQRNKKVLVALAIGAVMAAFLIPGLASRFAVVSDTSRAAGAAPTGNTLLWRLTYWAQVLPLANKNPVTGIGLAMTQYKTDSAKQPHNDFIRAYVETGILGFITYVAWLVSLVGLGRRAAKRAPPKSLERAIAVGYLGCAVAFVLESAGANVMSNVVCVWYLIAFAGAAAFISRTYDPARGPLNRPAELPAGETVTA
jgi:putative inorganic carbon (hco3(-)) transporter